MSTMYSSSLSKSSFQNNCADLNMAHLELSSIMKDIKKLLTSYPVPTKMVENKMGEFFKIIQSIPPDNEKFICKWRNSFRDLFEQNYTLQTVVHNESLAKEQHKQQYRFDKDKVKLFNFN